MNRVTIDDVELKRLRECSRIVGMVEELCGEPFMSITLHSDSASIPGHEHLITIMGSIPDPKACRGEDLKEYEAEHYGRSLVEWLEQAVAAKKERDEGENHEQRDLLDRLQGQVESEVEAWGENPAFDGLQLYREAIDEIVRLRAVAAKKARDE